MVFKYDNIEAIAAEWYLVYLPKVMFNKRTEFCSTHFTNEHVSEKNITLQIWLI